MGGRVALRCGGGGGRAPYALPRQYDAPPRICIPFTAQHRARAAPASAAAASAAASARAAARVSEESAAANGL